MKRYLNLIALLLLVSCGNKSRNIEGLWLFREEGESSGSTQPGSFLNLARDGRYTLFIPDYFDYGYWTKDPADSNTIQFNSKRPENHYGARFSMSIKIYNEKYLSVFYTLPSQVEQAGGGNNLAFDQVGSQLARAIKLFRSPVQYPDSLDPYSYNLNRWRLRSPVPESCRQIQFRTINYLKHMYALFREQDRQQSEQYGYPYSPSPLLYGQNGIATIDFDQIAPYWKNTFFNQSQARQSCAMLYALFDEQLHVPQKYKRPDELWTVLLKQMLDHALARDYCIPGQEPDTTRVR
ncbi:hypothetical protein [Taibaiella koreensis]|uniref:hypothetical protein n=1 Tax=Taibaiella koreensis TaxID=1268548 RepID=UPI000E59FF42|nr:hypothetical protein [Taibaiella koreensis]